MLIKVITAKTNIRGIIAAYLVISVPTPERIELTAPSKAPSRLSESSGGILRPPKIPIPGSMIAAKKSRMALLSLRSERNLQTAAISCQTSTPPTAATDKSRRSARITRTVFSGIFTLDESFFAGRRTMKATAQAQRKGKSQTKTYLKNRNRATAPTDRITVSAA